MSLARRLIVHSLTACLRSRCMPQSNCLCKDAESEDVQYYTQNKASVAMPAAQNVDSSFWTHWSTTVAPNHSKPVAVTHV